MKYEITIEKEWLDKFADKTIFKNASDKTSCLLFSSTKNSIVLEFDSHGKTIARSKLLIEDENNCNEVANNLKEVEVPYKVEERIPVRTSLRQFELKTLKESNNVSKCSYLYYEWFGKLETDISKMMKDFYQALEKEDMKNLHKIVSIIRLSYKGQV